MPNELGAQREFDFNRAQQLRLLEQAELPKRCEAKDGTGVSAKMLKSVLKAIDGYGRGRDGGAHPSFETIARSVGGDRRHVIRAVEVLETLGLVCKEQGEGRRGRIGSPTNRYTIVWTELAVRCERGLFARDQSGVGADQSGVGADQSGVGADQSGVGTPKPPRSAKNRHLTVHSDQNSDDLCGQSWREAEGVLLLLGLKAAAKACSEARRQSATADDVLSLAAYFREHQAREQWGPGILFYRVCQANPGGVPAAAFPPLENAPPEPLTPAAAQRKSRQRRRDRATTIVIAGRRAAHTEAQLTIELAAEGLTFDDLLSEPEIADRLEAAR